MLTDRKHIGALMHGPVPPISEYSVSDQSVFALATDWLGQRFGIPIVHDLTTWLRIGDVTFLRFGETSLDRRFQTIEVKSSVREQTVDEDGTTNAVITVNAYSNESLADLAQKLDGDKEPTAEDAPPSMSLREDRRLSAQLRRLYTAKRRGDAADDQISYLDGIRTITLQPTSNTTNHWNQLRSAIREARRNGYSYMSIDKFLGYAVFYNASGLRETDFAQSQMIDDITESTLRHQYGTQPALRIFEVPMSQNREQAGYPVIPFFNYEIPQIAKSDLIFGRLAIVGIVNMAPLKDALQNSGFDVVAEQDADEHQYRITLSWPSGETYQLHFPHWYIDREVARSVYEFTDLNDVVTHLAAIKDVPSRVSIEDWETSMHANAHAPVQLPNC
ncbi:hypothetical protein [Gordonia sp. CPCC 205333]|uniref:hypothetical protein n=1 Tax=Gordonia sp. CPCC 205333 TaxID=3140790 RepID=UPI003AF3470B